MALCDSHTRHNIPLYTHVGHFIRPLDRGANTCHNTFLGAAPTTQKDKPMSSFIPFKSRGNRLYIDLETYKNNPQLQEFIAISNKRRPGSFFVDYTNRCVWFYPPDNYVMPPLSNIADHV